MDSKVKNRSAEIKSFKESLQHASEAVRNWPEWKREVLRGVNAKYTQKAGLQIGKIQGSVKVHSTEGTCVLGQSGRKKSD